MQILGQRMLDSPHIRETHFTLLRALETTALLIGYGAVQVPPRVRLFATLWTAARQASLSLATSRGLPKVMSIASVMPSSHRIL